VKKFVSSLLIVCWLVALACAGDYLYSDVAIISPGGGEKFQSDVPGMNVIPVRWQSRVGSISNIWVCLQYYDDAFGYSYSPASDIQRQYVPVDTGMCDIVLDEQVSQSYGSGQCMIMLTFTCNMRQGAVISKQFTLTTPRAGIKIKSPLKIWASVVKGQPYRIQWDCIPGDLGVEGYILWLQRIGTSEHYDLTDWSNLFPTNVFDWSVSADLTDGQYLLNIMAISANQVVGWEQSSFYLIPDQCPPPRLLASYTKSGILLTVVGPENCSFYIESSADLKTWAKVTTQPLKGGGSVKVLGRASNAFFRALLVQ